MLLLHHYSRQRCKERQCHNLNSRVKKKEPGVLTEGTFVSTVPTDMTKYVVPSEESVEIEIDGDNFVENLVKDVFSAA